jgi:hypothetical protein
LAGRIEGDAPRMVKILRRTATVQQH